MSNTSPSAHNGQDEQLPQIVSAEAESAPENEITVPADNPIAGFVSLRGQELIERKSQLLKDHRRTNGSLIDMMQRGQIGIEEAMNIVIMELLKETDSLKGNELLFETEGNLRDATTVQVKRIEALEKAAKAIHRKHQIISDEVINLDSPYIRLLITWVLRMVQETFVELGYNAETVEVFINKFATKTADWKRDVKREIMALQDRQAQSTAKSPADPVEKLDEEERKET